MPIRQPEHRLEAMKRLLECKSQKDNKQKGAMKSARRLVYDKVTDVDSPKKQC